MSQKSKRRWYQFSLRTMLVLITAIACVSAVMKNRSERMHRKSNEHWHKFIYFSSMRRVFLIAYPGEDELNLRCAAWHKAKANACYEAAQAPWLPVFETPPDWYYAHAKWREKYDAQIEAEVRDEILHP